MRTITTEKMVFKFAELSDTAKEKARAWYQNLACTDSDWYDFIYEDATAIANLLGITFSTKRGSNSTSIYFSGFSSQGDGACFESSYRYSKGAVKAVRAYAPLDAELLRIAKGLQAVQRKWFYNLYATTKHRGHYYHAYCMSVDVEHSENQYQDIGGSEGEIAQLLRDFANWIYRQLEKEYEYQSSAEYAEENILANEYEFDINGNIS